MRNRPTTRPALGLMPLGAALLVTLMLGPSPATALTPAPLRDSFARTVNAGRIALFDWDGYLLNPAVRLELSPPGGAAFPVTATVRANHRRLYFDLPSTVGTFGPTRTLTFSNASQVRSFSLSIFPDRDGADEVYSLTVISVDAASARDTIVIPIVVDDQDLGSTPAFPITLDYSYDQTGFFADPAKRAILEQAANDWAYFIDDMTLDSVAPGTEQTFIWDPDGYVSGNYVTNASAYTGYLLYTCGFHHAALRSGGAPAFYGGFQSSGGSPLDLKRSGTVEVETQGNYNTLGWYLMTGDDDWFQTGNLGGEANDLYSIAHHEIGHALMFNPGYPVFAAHKSAGSFQDADVLAYQGAYPAIDASDHLAGAIDASSRRGAFGYEYFGEMPQKRWLITKLDLLCAQGVGYALRATSAFEPLAIVDAGLDAGAAGVAYADTLRASGGNPTREWSITSGSLPAGLYLDSFSGAIAGVATQAGTFPLTLRVRDSAIAPGVSSAASITIGSGLLSVDEGLAVPRFEAIVPNPTSGPATLRFVLPRTGSISLEVFTIAGRRVAHVASGRFEAGAHEVRWDEGSLAPGLYLCRLKADGFSRTRKLVVRE